MLLATVYTSEVMAMISDEVDLNSSGKSSHVIKHVLNLLHMLSSDSPFCFANILICQNVGKGWHLVSSM